MSGWISSSGLDEWVCDVAILHAVLEEWRRSDLSSKRLTHQKRKSGDDANRPSKRTKARNGKARLPSRPWLQLQFLLLPRQPQSPLKS